MVACFRQELTAFIWEKRRTFEGKEVMRLKTQLKEGINLGKNEGLLKKKHKNTITETT